MNYQESWPPINQKDLKERGIDQVDVVVISGDAYVDHPSFGAAIITRYLESLGLTVGVVPQPNWQDDLRDFKKLGTPRLFFAVTSGNMDSMVNHYTANKRLRSNDAYTPGGRAGFRPDYAVNVYSQILKKLFPASKVVIGGIEASLRRNSHYDFWSDRLLPSILLSSGADLLIYGGGEKPLAGLVRLLKKGVPFGSINTLNQSAFISKDSIIPKNKKWETIQLHSHEECLLNKQKFGDNFKVIETEANRMNGARLIQEFGTRTVVVNPVYPPIKTKELDSYYDLPFLRVPHPKYNKRGEIPAYNMIKGSINSHRGCFGGCSFCSISAHQGKFVVSRSKRSLLKEVDVLVSSEKFDGVISDLGGPSSNMYMMEGKDKVICKECSRCSCIYPKICKNLNIDHSELIDLFETVEKKKGVKHLYTTSGIRYDMLLENRVGEENNGLKYLNKIIKDHTSGRFKVAPEHSSNVVLKLMRKPSFYLFKELKKLFDKYSMDTPSANQEIVPYFISSHPGCTNLEMEDLAKETSEMGYKLEQIQDFTPTPMTLSTVMYYTGHDPYSSDKSPIFVAKKNNERLEQRRYFFWYLPENKDIYKKIFSLD